MTQTSGADHLEDLLCIAVDECDRHYPSFLTLASGSELKRDDLSLAMMTACGQS
jgi:hypothetical protein